VFSALLLALAVVDLALLVWAARAWLTDRANYALLMQVILLLLLWFDVMTVGLGATIGDGPMLGEMSRIRYTWFYLTMPLLLIAVGALARQAGFVWAKNKVLMGALCLLAVAFIVRETPVAWTADYQLACWQDTVRHVFRVPVGQACSPGAEGLGSAPSSPAIPIIFLSVTLMGVLLWVRRGWPWLALSALVFMGSTAIPTAIVGPFLTYPLDTLMTAAFVVTAMKFSPRRQTGNP